MKFPGAALTVALSLAPEIARADDPTLVLVGDPSSPVTARVRVELESLGHRVVAEPAPDARGRVALSLSAERLVATVAMRDRPPTEIATLTATRDAVAVFALRVGEAVRAGMLAPPPPPPPPLAVPTEPAFGVAFGARLLAAPGGFAPMVLPAVTFRWSQRVYVALSLAPLSWGGGAAGPSTLRVFTAGLGAGVALRPSAALRVDLGARVEYLDLAHSIDGRPETEQRDGAVAASATGSVRWRANAFFAVRGEASAGLSLREVLLVLRDGTVAQWGRPLVGAEIDAEFLF
ncbi:MAG: hypothetical protein U0324_28420 [Polyangiales bacterium]